MFWLWTLVLSLVFAVVAALGVYVATREQGSGAPRLLALAVLANLGWILAVLIHVWDPAQSERAPPLLGALGGFFGTLVFPLMLHFALLFPRPLFAVRRAYLVLIYLPASFFALAWAGGGLAGGAALLQGPYAGWVFAQIAAIAGLLAWKGRRLRQGVEREQVKWVLGGFVLSGVLVGLGALVLPLAGVRTFKHASPLFLLAWMGCTAYAMARFRLFAGALERARAISVTRKVRVFGALVSAVVFCCAVVPPVYYLVGSGEAGLWWKVSLVVLGALVLQGLLVGLALWALVSGPLGELARTAARLGEGDWQARAHLRPHAPLGGRDEMDLLAESFNRMAARLQENQRQLLRSARLAAVGQLAAGIAHEVNNPLGSISSLAQLQMERAQSQGDREALRMVVAQVERISSVLGDLVHFSRPRPPARTAVEVAPLVQEVLRLVSFDNRFRGIEVECDFDARVGHLRADADQLQQVLLNLLLNAGDAMPGGGTLRLSTRAQGAFLMLAVEDSGEGIRPEHMDRIFDPFFTTREPGRGTGLGLSLCYGIVQAHAGRIEVESRLGEGTRFSVYLPLEESHA